MIGEFKVVDRGETPLGSYTTELWCGGVLLVTSVTTKSNYLPRFDNGPYRLQRAWLYLGPRMIDPNNFTNYGRTDHELEEMWLFSVAVAGKTAKTQARLLVLS